MATTTDFATRGNVLRAGDGTVVFQPAGTNYELHLGVTGPYAGPLNRPVYGVISVVARKLWTVPSGGNFVSPIFGPPRTIQGRVLMVDAKTVVLRAGATFVVRLPEADSGIDLNSGPVTVGDMANVVGQPGATFEAVAKPAPVGA